LIHVDPGPGNGIVLPLEAVSDTLIFEDSGISVEGLPTGSHTLTIRYKNNHGEWSHNHTMDFTVCPPPGPPIVDFNVYHAGLSLYLEEETQFADSFLWEFGDGSTLNTTETLVSHLYDEQGTYEITLTAYSALCGQTSMTMQVFVTDITHDLELSNVIYPNSSCDLSNSEFLELTVSNIGAASQNSFTINVLVNAELQVSETFNVSLAGGQSLDTTLNLGLDLSQFGNYFIDVELDLPNDQNLLNNASNSNLEHYSPVSQEASFGIMLPTDGAINLVEPVLFTWQSVDDAATYDLWLWQNGETPSQAYIENISSVNIEIDNLDANGEYLWFVRAYDNCGTYLNSDTLSFSTPPLSDLVVETLDTPEGQLFAGSNIAVQWTVKNNEPGYSGNDTWFDAIYISNDEQLDLGDYLIGSVPRSYPLSFLEAYTIDYSFDIPLSQFGTKFLIVKTDRFNSIEEDNEDNNIFVSDLLEFVDPYVPDLHVFDIISPGTLGVILAGETDNVEWKVENQTDQNMVAIAPWFDRVYISAQQVFNEANATVLGTLQHNENLSPGNFYSAGLPVTIPDNLEQGHYFIHVFSDFSNLVNEGNFEGSNNVDTASVYVLELAEPDLNFPIITSMPDTVSNGQSAPVQWQAENSAAGFSDNWNDRFETYTNSNGTGYVSGQSFGVSDSLDTFDTYSKSGYLNIPDNGSGWHYIHLKLDYNNNVEEVSESNNTFVDSVFVLSPDLQPASVDVFPLAVDGFEMITIYWTVTNNGPGELYNQWLDGIYISDSPVFNQGEAILLGTHFGVPYPSINGHGSSKSLSAGA
jgi:hypothetical protein